MKKRRLFNLLLLFVALSAYTQEFTEIAISNPVFHGANYPAKFHLGEYALNDTFTYDPNFPTLDTPLQGWTADNTTHCFSAIGTWESVGWEADFTLEAGTKLYALDLWGRVWNGEPGGTLLPLGVDGADRTKNLYISIWNDDSTLVWETPASWSGASNPADGAYARFNFNAADIPKELLASASHILIRKGKDSGQFRIHIDELRLVAEPSDLTEITISNPVFHGANYTNRFHLGEYALNDTFKYEANYPTRDVPLQGWTADNTTHCFSGIGTWTSVGWEADFTLAAGTRLYALDLWGRVWNGAPGGTLLPLGQDGADRTKNLYLSIWNDDSTLVWETPSSWSGTSDPADGAYARFYFNAPDIPKELLKGASHILIRKGKDSGQFRIHIDELRLVAVPIINKSPVANAGANQTVIFGATVTLDGSGSSDPDGDSLSYSWTSVTDDGIVLSDSTAVSPTFTAPGVTGSYVFELIVLDGTDTSDVSAVTITVNAPPNTKPVANAGTNQTVIFGATVTLDGSNSSDADSDSLSYSWTSATDDGIALSDSTAISPTFTAPGTAGNYIFELIVNDGTIDSDVSSVTITVNAPPNKKPIANAGSNQTVDAATQVTLNGSGSSDPDGDNLIYSWTSVTDAGIALSDSTAESPTFTAPDTAGNYIFELVVNDGTIDSDVSSVTITVTAGSGIESVVTNSLNVYPNPSVDGFTIDLSEMTGKSKLTIASMNGDVLYNKIVTSDKHRINSDMLNSGIYLLQVESNNTILMKKIVIR